MAEATWELTILDAAPPTVELAGLTAGDLDKDGHVEIITGGMNGLFWYRSDTRERGMIAEFHSSVGIALEDLDGDGVLEVVTAYADPPSHLLWFKPGKSLHDPWEQHFIDDAPLGHSHDILFADLDNDGETEMVVNAVYSPTPGLYIYKRTADLTAPWTRLAVQTGYVEEGLAVGDLDGDGKLEIVSGPDWYHCPEAGAFSGPWERHIFAPSHREMCRVALLDVTGNGRPDIFIVDSEYMDGRLSWFENRLSEDPANPWVEHVMEDGLIYAHSLKARYDGDHIRVFCAEMGQGGWNAPRNWDARVIEYVSADRGVLWQRQVISRGEGTHEAMYVDIDSDGIPEIVGKDGFENINGKLNNPRVQIWKLVPVASPLSQYKHRFLDRDKPETAIDILHGDIDGDGQPEVLCGKWWYRLDGAGGRQTIPGIHQAIAVVDLDGDGQNEVIAIKPTPGATDFWNKLSSDLVWLKPIDLAAGEWKEYSIGQGSGNWPHGVLVAPLLPGGQLALITGYHSAGSEGVRPEIWEIPADPTQGPWPKRILADIAYGEEFVAADIDGDGKLDIVAGAHWLENCGDGTFTPHVIAEGFQAARVAVGDFNGDGRPDVLLGEEILDFKNNITPRSALVWFENPPDPRQSPWPKHVVDTVRCAHSVAAADLDGDGVPEIICGEHDPFWPYRTRCRLSVYKKTDPSGIAWTRFILDDRFEHHDGTKVVDLGGGRLGILSHGWKDSIYVHLWEPR